MSYRGPDRGTAAIYVDGVYKTNVNLHTINTHPRQVVYATNWSANGTHTIKIVCLGTTGHPRIDVDAFVVLSNAPHWRWC